MLTEPVTHSSYGDAVRIKLVRWFEDDGDCLLTFDARWSDSAIYEYITEMLDGEDPDEHGFQVATEELIEYEAE